MIKKVLLILLLALVLIQFIQPVRNQSGQAYPADFGQVYAVPGKVYGILKNACYDCHSNNTKYPWYARLQPGAWWMASHIRKGKEELNFNAFGDYSPRRQQSKLKAIASSIEDGTMPLPSYTLIHKSARLSSTDKKLLLDWLNNKKNSLLENK
ncbi:MAG: heme-binding domain-containing protein [Taibaiella sp.]|jgi:hypothetical protein